MRAVPGQDRDHHGGGLHARLLRGPFLGKVALAGAKQGPEKQKVEEHGGSPDAAPSRTRQQSKKDGEEEEGGGRRRALLTVQPPLSSLPELPHTFPQMSPNAAGEGVKSQLPLWPGTQKCVTRDPKMKI